MQKLMWSIVKDTEILHTYHALFFRATCSYCIANAYINLIDWIPCKDGLILFYCHLCVCSIHQSQSDPWPEHYFFAVENVTQKQTNKKTLRLESLHWDRWMLCTFPWKLWLSPNPFPLLCSWNQNYSFIRR